MNREISVLLNSLSREKLKIAVISYYFEPPTLSGVGIHSRSLAQFLVRQGCEVHVFCSNADSGSYRAGGVIVHNIGRTLSTMKNSSSRTRLEYFLFESEVVKAVIRENSKRAFDIVHTQGSLTKAAFILKKVYGIRWVHTFHAIERVRVKKLSKEEKHFEDLVSWIESTVNYSDGVIYVSNPLYRQGKRLYSPARNKVIPNGVDRDLFRHSPIREKNVLFIGRFSKEKGVGILPEVIERVMGIEGATITLVAPYRALPRELRAIRERIGRLERKFGKRVKVITQPMDQAPLASLYRDCQVYIQPSNYESFGLCILEAMATGRPVVSFRVGGIPELIGDCGFLVKDKQQLLSTIEGLLDDKGLCQAVGEKAHLRAGMFGWEAVSKEVLDYYKVILHE